MVMEGDLTLGSEHTIQYTVNILQNVHLIINFINRHLNIFNKNFKTKEKKTHC